MTGTCSHELLHGGLISAACHPPGPCVFRLKNTLPSSLARSRLVVLREDHTRPAVCTTSHPRRAFNTAHLQGKGTANRGPTLHCWRRSVLVLVATFYKRRDESRGDYYQRNSCCHSPVPMLPVACRLVVTSLRVLLQLIQPINPSTRHGSEDDGVNPRSKGGKYEDRPRA